MTPAELTVAGTSTVGVLGLLFGWMQQRRQIRKDYTSVALDGLDKLIEELRVEMVRRDQRAVAREAQLVTEVARLRRDVRVLTAVMKANGVAMPKMSHLDDEDGMLQVG